MPASKTSKTEIIDERILRLLGLEDVFDLDYGTYTTLLKEALVKHGVIGKEKIPTEEIELLRGEYKKARGKSGRFKAKSKKIKAGSISGLKIIKDKKILEGGRKVKALPSAVKTKKTDEEKGSVDQEPSKKGKIKGSKDTLENIVSSIRKSVDSIADSVKSITKVLNKGLVADKKRAENQRRLEKEKGLEGGKAGGALKKMVGAVIKPFESIFDKIFRFIFVTLLGNTFFKLLDWFNDEKNQKKIDNIFRFIKDWWPAILTGFLAFATPLGGFIATITGTLIRGLFMLARVNPALTAALALFGAGAAIPMLFPETVDEQERKIAEAEGTNEEKIKKLKEQKENLNWFQKNVQGMGPEIDEQIYRLETGQTKSYRPDDNKDKDGPQKLFNGGKVNFHPQTIRGNGGNFARGGKINKTSGVKISGAGPDTQLIAAQPGEVVINKKTVDAVGAKNLLALNSAYGGSNANKPMYAGNVRAARFGGLIRAFAEGGEVPNADSKSDPSYAKNGRALKKQKREQEGEGQTGAAQTSQRHAELLKSTDPQKIADYDAKHGTGAYAKKLQQKLSNIYQSKGYQSKVNPQSKIVPTGNVVGRENLSPKARAAIARLEDKRGLPSDMQYTRNGKKISAESFNRTKGMMNAVKEGGVKGALNHMLSGARGMFGGIFDKLDSAINNPQSFVESMGGTVRDGNIGTPTAEEQKAIDRLNAKKEKLRQTEQKLLGLKNKPKKRIQDDPLYAEYTAIENNPHHPLFEKVRGSGDLDDFGMSFSEFKKFKASKAKGKVGGGMIDINEGTGYDIPGGTADRQFLPFAGGGGIAVQPGEKLVALTKDAVDKGGAQMVESVNAKLDSNSNAWKKGGVTPLPPGSGGSKMMELPPSVIDNRKPEQMPGSVSESTDISTSPPFGMELREQIKRLYYGIGAPS